MKDLGFFLALARPHAIWLRLGAALAAVTLLAGIGLIAVSGWFIAAAAAGGLASALAATRGVRAFALLRPVSRYAERLVTHDATFRILARLRVWTFERLIPLSPGGIARMRSGDLVARVTGDVDALDGLYLRFLTPVAAAAAGAAGVAVLLALAAPLALPAILFLFLVSAVGLPVLTARASRKAGERASDMAALVRAEAGDLAAGLAELKAYGADTRVRHRLDEASRAWTSAQRDLARLTMVNSAVLALGAPLALVTALGLATAGGAGAGVAVLCGFAAFALFEGAAPLVQAAEGYGRMQRSAARLRAIAEQTGDVVTPAAPVAPSGRHDVRVEALSFAYAGSETPALEHVSLALPEGSRLALTGASGSGKSSLIKILMRFYPVPAGTVWLGGQDVTTLDPREVRRRFALVDQRAELISASVRENLRLGAPGAEDGALWKALELARADDVVRALPDGLDTWLGEFGSALSGGQARRIALARAFVTGAPVLLLDEPTEGLDAPLEHDFLTSLGEWADADERRSFLLVTHRARVLDAAREAIVLEKGRIAQKGPVASLTGPSTAFSRLFPDYRRAS